MTDDRVHQRSSCEDESADCCGPAPLAVDAKGLAKRLELSVRTIRTMDTAGKLPRPIRLNGHSVRWPIGEIKDWLNAGAPDRRTWEALKRERR
jgi:predicted DNA-binding transcriptional regulator AlpA